MGGEPPHTTAPQVGAFLLEDDMSTVKPKAPGFACDQKAIKPAQDAQKKRLAQMRKARSEEKVRQQGGAA